MLKYDNSDRKLDNLKDMHKGRRCFILGTGASLNDVDLAKLKGEIIISCNEIWEYYRQGKLPVKPTYYCASCTAAYEGIAPLSGDGIEWVAKMGSIKVFEVPRIRKRWLIIMLQ